MADNGGGHFYFAGDVAQMRDHITSEVGETLEVVAREVVARADRCPRSVRVDSLSPFRVEQARRPRPDPASATSCPGQVADASRCASRSTSATSGREVGALHRRDRPRPRRSSRPRRRWRRSRSRGSTRTTPANDAQPRDLEVDRAVARPVRRARPAGGRPAQPRGPLRRRAPGARWRPQARRAATPASDPQLNAIVAQLNDEQVHYAAPMPEMARKARHYAASLACRMRTPDGKSTRA